MPKKEAKTCLKCGEYYFGDACVGCHSNQYAHYTTETSTKSKILISLTSIVILVLIIINR
jgi:uncharacterized membrane protein YvbJ